MYTCFLCFLDTHSESTDCSKENIEECQLRVNIPVMVEDGFIIVKKKTLPSIILIDSEQEDNDLDFSEGSSVECNVDEPYSVHTPNEDSCIEDEPVEVMEYASEVIIVSSQASYTSQDVSKAVFSLIETFPTELQKRSLAFFENQEVPSSAVKSADSFNIAIVEQSVLMDSTDLKVKNESECITLNPEDIDDVLNMKYHEKEIGLDVAVLSNITNDVVTAQVPTATKHSPELLILPTEKEEDVDSELVGVECDFNVMVTLPSIDEYTKTDDWCAEATEEQFQPPTAKVIYISP